MKMTGINEKSLSVLAVLVLFGGALVSAGIGDGGSKCPDASCSPAPPGAQCEPKYGERDECCPVWYCTNGQQSYGMTRGSSSFSSFSSTTSGAPGKNPFGQGGGFGQGSFGGNPFGGSPFGNNPFGNMFNGNLLGGFGRR